MHTVKFIEQCVNQVHERLVKSLQGLTQEELVWRPVPRANCIAEIVLHVARSADRMAGPGIGLWPELWESQHWYKRFGHLKGQDPRTAFQLLRVSGLPTPRLEDLLAYIEAVHQDTLRKVRGLSPDDLDRVPDPSHPERSIASTLRHLITHTNNPPWPGRLHTWADTAHVGPAPGHRYGTAVGRHFPYGAATITGARQHLFLCFSFRITGGTD
jgi:hypothetical protein